MRSWGTKLYSYVPEVIYLVGERVGLQTQSTLLTTTLHMAPLSLLIYYTSCNYLES